MAQELGIDPDVVDTACLAHDLGHPPFGHNGEAALNEWSKDFGGFEGNAQTLRLLSRIEPKVFDPQGNSRGLNLTRAVLDASCKYPWGRESGQPETGGDFSVKFGYYQDDKDVFDFLRQGATPMRKCIEAEVMDFADDVAYSVHDFEDAIVAGYIDLAEINSKSSDSELLGKISQWAGSSLTISDLEAALARLRSQNYWLSSHSGEMKDQATLKNLTSALIGSFVRRTTDQTELANASEHLVRYQGALVVPSEVRAEIAVLKGIVSAYLMSDEKRQPYYQWQRAILSELADALLAANGKHLDTYCASAWQQATTQEQRHRVVVDQVASLTDVSALSLHHELVTK
jgi:dGTPase